jgi:hypothetical protein
VSFGKRNVNASRVGFGAAPVGAAALGVRVGAPAVDAGVRVAPPAASVTSDQLNGSPLDVAWLVLEAANDLGDEPTVEACRRIIDASLNGKSPPQDDLTLVTDYFR